jgi:hypothetical protein
MKKPSCGAVTGFVLSSMLSAALVSVAQDFRVETDVFVANQQQPVAEYLTLFHGQVVYDYRLTPPQEVVVLDLARNRFILLDISHRIKTELTTHDVELFHQRVRERMNGRDATYFQAQFTHQYDAETHTHKLDSEKWSYQAVGSVPKNPDYVQRYRVFADWSVQLAAMRPGSFPPYGRLELNRLLAEHGEVPESVERTVTIARVFPPRRETLRTTHLYNWLLSEQDHRRIRRTGDDMAAFTPVSPEKYFQPIP